MLSRRSLFTGLVGAAAPLRASVPKRRHAHVGNLACPAFETVNVAIIGVGFRGCGAVYRLSAIPGVRVAAIGDLFKERTERYAKWLTDRRFPAPKTAYGAQDAWKRLVEDPEINLVYVATPWQCHVEMVLHALECGKHVACEVPLCFTVEEAWRIVNKAEEKRVHCMLLENCCYGYSEMLALNMVRHGLFGALVHGEAAYIHQLAHYWFNGPGDNWRLKWNTAHTGNPYPTHGLGPICQYMDIGRGDQMRVFSALSTKPIGLPERAHNGRDAIAKRLPKATGADYGMADRRALTGPWAQGDMSTAIIKTEKNRTILLQHDVVSPRPYTRINLISGTKGILRDYPLRLAFDPDAHAWLGRERREALQAKYQHPLWRDSGAIAQKVGGHGGMDFLMDLRLCFCLQHGKPLDINVYESCQWSMLAELTEQSTLRDGAPIAIPDLTRGAWERDIAPLPIESVDIKLDSDATHVGQQLNV